MPHINVQSVIKRSYNDYVKELDQIRMETIRARLSVDKTSNKNGYEQSRKSKPE